MGLMGLIGLIGLMGLIERMNARTGGEKNGDRLEQELHRIVEQGECHEGEEEKHT